MHKTKTDPYYEEKLKNAIENFKKWCSNNPSCIGKGCCQDCVHLIDPKQYGECSGPPLDRNELCEPGYQKFELSEK